MKRSTSLSQAHFGLFPKCFKLEFDEQRTQKTQKRDIDLTGSDFDRVGVGIVVLVVVFVVLLVVWFVPTLGHPDGPHRTVVASTQTLCVFSDQRRLGSWLGDVAAGYGRGCFLAGCCWWFRCFSRDLGGIMMFFFGNMFGLGWFMFTCLCVICIEWCLLFMDSGCSVLWRNIQLIERQSGVFLSGSDALKTLGVLDALQKTVKSSGDVVFKSSQE